MLKGEVGILVALHAELQGENMGFLCDLPPAVMSAS